IGHRHAAEHEQRNAEQSSREPNRSLHDAAGEQDQADSDVRLEGKRHGQQQEPAKASGYWGMSDSPTGLIGVGLLGTALAERMLAAGLRVLGYDAQASAGQRLVTLGGRIASSATEVAASCACIVLALPDSNVVRGVVDSLGEAFSVGRLIIDATTGDPDET